MSGFHDVRLSPQISRGARGGPRYRTTIVTNASGFEQRVREWDESLYRWEFDMEFWSDARRAELIEFFHARGGAAHGFRFKDWSDYYVGMQWNGNSLEYLGAASVPQFATGDGSTTTFQLTKSYTSGPSTRTRRITRPIVSTVKVWFGTTEQTTGWAVDPATGVITFTSAPGAGVVIRWAGQFDVPVRFEQDDMRLAITATVRSGSWSSISVVGIKEEPVIVQASSWSPLDISGLEYWFDALDIAQLWQDSTLATPVTGTSQPVGGWKDKANSRHALQATSTRRPTYSANQLNTLPAVLFDGVDDLLMRATSPTLAQPISIYLVTRWPSVPASTQHIMDGGGDTVDRVRVFSTAAAVRTLNAGAGLSYGTATTTARFTSLVVNGTSSAAYIDGTLAGGVGAAGSQSLSGITMGANRNGGQLGNVAIGEVIIYSGAHGTSTRQRVEEYLRSRWGFS